MNWYLAPYQEYAVFFGRTRRKGFWPFVIINTLFIIVFFNLGSWYWSNGPKFLGFLCDLFMLIFLIGDLVPTVAVGVRRLHDTGKSGYWWFLFLVPVVGWLILMIFFLMDSQPSQNKYGPNPKAPPEPPISSLDALQRIKAQKEANSR